MLLWADGMLVVVAERLPLAVTLAVMDVEYDSLMDGVGLSNVLLLANMEPDSVWEGVSVLDASPVTVVAVGDTDCECDCNKE